MVLFGLGLLFVRAAWIERDTLVASLTLITTLIACVVLYSNAPRSNQFTSSQMVSLMMLSVLGFGIGWLYDRLIGPKPLAPRDDREATLGAELAD